MLDWADEIARDALCVSASPASLGDVLQTGVAAALRKAEENGYKRAIGDLDQAVGDPKTVARMLDRIKPLVLRAKADGYRMAARYYAPDGMTDFAKDYADKIERGEA